MNMNKTPLLTDYQKNPTPDYISKKFWAVIDNFQSLTGFDIIEFLEKDGTKFVYDPHNFYQWQEPIEGAYIEVELMFEDNTIVFNDAGIEYRFIEYLLRWIDKAIGPDHSWTEKRFGAPILSGLLMKEVVDGGDFRDLWTAAYQNTWLGRSLGYDRIPRSTVWDSLMAYERDPSEVAAAIQTITFNLLEAHLRQKAVEMGLSEEGFDTRERLDDSYELEFHPDWLMQKRKSIDKLIRRLIWTYKNAIAQGKTAKKRLQDIAAVDSGVRKLCGLPEDYPLKETDYGMFSFITNQIGQTEMTVSGVMDVINGTMAQLEKEYAAIAR